TLDPARGLGAEHWHLGVEGWVERADLYRRYRTWCQEGGRLPLSNATFNDHLGHAFPDRIDLRKRHGTWVWQGLAWGPGADADNDGAWKGEPRGAAPGAPNAASPGAAGAAPATLFPSTDFSPSPTSNRATREWERRGS